MFQPKMKSTVVLFPNDVFEFKRILICANLLILISNTPSVIHYCVSHHIIKIVVQRNH